MPLHLVLSIWQKTPRKATLIADMLIAGGSQVNRQNYDKWAAIHLASRRGQTGAIKWILNKNQLLESVGHEKFDISIAGGVQGWTPLHLAANGGHFELVECMTSAGADILKRNADNYTARDCVKSNLGLYKKMIRLEQTQIRKGMLNNEEQESLQATSAQEKSIEDDKKRLLDRSIPLSERYSSLHNLLSNKDGKDSLPDLLLMLEDGVLRADAVYRISRENMKMGIERILTV